METNGARMKKSCGFATTVWENDWKAILLKPDYLSKQIENHNFFFEDRLLVINNVLDLDQVTKAAQTLVDVGVLTRFIVAETIVSEVLNFFELKKEDFRSSENNVSDNWIYFNALGPLCAIYCQNCEYLLYQTGDVRLDRPVSWIERTIALMEKNPQFKVANLLWNNNIKEAKNESYKKTWNFFYAKQGFSDQQFLVSTKVFRQPIYSTIHPESHHFPRGDVFEKRAFSFLKYFGFQRLIFRRGSYIHENIIG